MFRPKKYYSSWVINEKEFPDTGTFEEKVRFLLRYALLAPSSFNVQPWKFKITKDKIYIKPDFSRRLPTSDKDNRLLYISIGCLLKNLEIAANWFGYKVNQKTLKKGVNLEFEFSIIQADSETSKINPNYVCQRLSNRYPYIPTKKLPTSFLEDIQKITKEYGFEPCIVADKEIKSKINALVEKGDYIMWNDKKFKKEHLQWVRNNITRKPDGMPAFTVGIPLIPSLLANFVIKNTNFAKMQANKNQNLLSTTPYYFFILSRTHDQETWVRVGQALEEIWVLATEKGISMTPLAQIVEIGDLYKDTMSILKTTLRPQFFLRLGYSTRDAEHSPRRSLEDMLF